MFGCNLLLVKKLVWVFQLWQTGSFHRSLPCHLCCILLYRITAFAGWSSHGSKMWKVCNFLPLFSKCWRQSLSHVFMHFYFPISSNCLCKVSSEVLCCVVTLFFSFLYHRCSSLSVFILCWRSQQPDNLSHKKAYPFSRLLSLWICDTRLGNLSHLT